MERFNFNIFIPHPEPACVEGGIEIQFNQSIMVAMKVVARNIHAIREEA